ALMQSAAQQLAHSLENISFNTPVIPVVQNVAAEIEMDPGRLRANLVKQLYSPVLWTQTMHRLAQLEVGRIVECGPGKVLSGLAKRTLNDAQLVSTSTVGEFNGALDAMR